MRIKPGDIYRVGNESRRPQHQRDRSDIRIIGRGAVWREHAGGRRRHLQQAAGIGERRREDFADERDRRQRIVPGGRAARPRVGGRCQKHQAARLLGIRERKRGRFRRSPGMADDDRLLDAERIHQCGERPCLSERRLVLARAALGPAMAGPVEEQQFGAGFEQRPRRHHLVLEIGAGAMDEDDRRQLGRGRRRHMHEVDARPVDGRECADRRIAPLDQPDAGPRHAGQDKHQGKQEIDGGEGDVHAYCMIREREPGSCRGRRIRCLRRPALPKASRPRSGRCASSDRFPARGDRLSAPSPSCRCFSGSAPFPTGRRNGAARG